MLNHKESEALRDADKQISAVLLEVKTFVLYLLHHQIH